MDDAIGTLASDQKRWSVTASQLKKSISRSRLSIIGLAIAGAVLETLAAQVHQSVPDLAVWVGYAGAAALAVIAVVRQWKLGRERVQAWILARAASESFKRELYLYRTSAGAYAASSNPAATLFDRREEILGKVRSVQKYVGEPEKSTLNVPGPLDAEEYIKERVEGQIDWFRRRAAQNAKLQGLFGGAEFLLAIAGALLGAALTMTNKQVYGAWVAVITTVTGALGAHALAQRYEQLAVSYRATADRLASVVGRWRAVKGSLSQLVEQCEVALLEENQGWIAGADETMKENNGPPPAPGGTAGGQKTTS
jgi:hypothetical protein